MGIMEIAPPLRRLGIAASLTRCSWSGCEGDSSEVLREASNAVKGALNLAGLKNHKIVRAYRNIMWRLGIDPTKVRPSGEALVRRVLRGRGVRPITPAVDACNAASMTTLIVISVFDASRVRLPLTLRNARKGEAFQDFSGRARVLDGSEIVLTDSEGKILHLYPYRDSATAAVNEGTREVIAVAYGAPGIDLGSLIKALTTFQEYLMRLCDGVACSEVEVAK